MFHSTIRRQDEISQALWQGRHNAGESSHGHLKQHPATSRLPDVGSNIISGLGHPQTEGNLTANN